jgi:hypothetical protein
VSDTRTAITAELALSTQKQNKLLAKEKGKARARKRWICWLLLVYITILQAYGMPLLSSFYFLFRTYYLSSLSSSAFMPSTRLLFFSDPL